jgi:hypothetical protein
LQSRRISERYKQISRILRGHAALNFDRTARSIDGAGKLHQHAGAGGFDDTAAMRSDGRIDEGLARRQP